MVQVFTPSDSVITPIVSALSSNIQAQLTNPATFYLYPPDGPPDDNSYVFALDKFQVKADGESGGTNGVLGLFLSFKFYHFFRKSTFGDNLTSVYNLYLPYLSIFSAWYNQSLGGLARAVTPKGGKVMQVPFGDEPHVALVLDLEVETEFNVPLS